MTYQNLLVTGGAGFIGSSFVAQQVAKGRRVIVLDKLTYAGHTENLSWLESGYELIIGDIGDQALVSKILRENNIDAIINFAAESHVDNSISAPAEFIQTNIVGTFSLLSAALNYFQETQKKHFRFLHISTDEVFGELGETGKFSEETAYAPNSPYSASKAASDHLVRAWHHTYALPTLITNCTNNYGPRQFPEKLIPHMIQCALAGKDLPIYGDGKNVRDWIHVDDHNTGVNLVLEKGKIGETYCLGGNAERNNNDVVQTLCQTLDTLKPRADQNSYTTQITYVKDRAGHDKRYAIDCTKIETELGFKRAYNFETGLQKTVQWYLDNQQWIKDVTST
ncbi:MAG: dTDP-glucose 4,6-dehydratase [Alphaproteobacteria bacterium]